MQSVTSYCIAIVQIFLFDIIAYVQIIHINNALLRITILIMLGI